MSHDDDVARLRAELDQAAAAVKEVGATLWAFYSALTEQGFASAQAMTLTATWLSGMLRNQGGNDA